MTSRRRSGAAAHELPKQQQRRDVSPVQVLEDEQQPLRLGGVQQQPHARRRRARAASARAVPGPRPRHGAADGPSSGTSRANSSAAAAGSPRLVGQPGTVRRVVPQRLHERLIRRDALLVGTPIEHDIALGMRPSGDPRRQARLADARLAGQHHQAAPAARGLLPAARSRCSGAARPTNGRRSSRASTRGQRHGRRADSRNLRADSRRAEVPRSARHRLVALAARSRSGRDAPRRARRAGCDHSSPLDIRVPTVESTHTDAIGTRTASSGRACDCSRRAANVGRHSARVPPRRASCVWRNYLKEGTCLVSASSACCSPPAAAARPRRRARRGPAVRRLARAAARPDDASSNPPARTTARPGARAASTP